MTQTYRVTWTVYGVPHAKTVKGPLLSILRNLQESEEKLEAFEITKLLPESEDPAIDTWGNPSSLGQS
jgi:hypothetical protein